MEKSLVDIAKDIFFNNKVYSDDVFIKIVKEVIDGYKKINSEFDGDNPLMTYYDFRDKKLMGYTHLMHKMRELNNVVFDENMLKLKQEYISYLEQNNERT